MAIQLKNIQQLPSSSAGLNSPVIFGNGTDLFRTTLQQFLSLIDVTGISNINVRKIDTGLTISNNEGTILDNVSLSVNAEDLVILRFNRITPNGPESVLFFVNLQAGTYSPLSSQISFNDLIFISRDFNIEEENSNTTTFTFNSLTDINTADPSIDLSDSSQVYLITIDGQLYKFNGVNQFYGANTNQLFLIDLEQIGQQIVQESKIETIYVDQQTKQKAVEGFNNSFIGFVADTSSLYIKAIFVDVLNGILTTRIYGLISKKSNGQKLLPGNYGQGSGNPIDFKNLVLLRREQQASSDDLENAPGTVTENLGDLGTTTVKDYINGLTNGLTLINSTDTLTIINAVVDGLDISYRYVGGDATYGANDSTIADSNLELLEKEENQIQLYWEPGIAVAGQPVTQIRPANNRVVSGTHLKDNSTPETKLTHNVRDKLNTLQATPATTGPITVPLNRVMGTDFTGTVTDIESFVVDTANSVLGGTAIYKFNRSSEPKIYDTSMNLIANAKLTAVSSDFIAYTNMYLIINKQADGVKYNIITA